MPRAGAAVGEAEAGRNQRPRPRPPLETPFAPSSRWLPCSACGKCSE